MWAEFIRFKMGSMVVLADIVMNFLGLKRQVISGAAKSLSVNRS
jgi:hypothetical protein